MKILAISPTYLPMKGGAEIVIDLLYKGLADRGHTIDLITPNLGGKTVETYKKLTIHRVGKKVNSRISKFFYYQKEEFKKINELIKTKSYDLISCQFILPSGWVANHFAKKLDIPVTYFVHHFGTGMDICSYEENSLPLRLYMKGIVKNTDLLTPTGSTQLAFLKRLTKNKNIRVINLGVDTELFTPKNKTDKFHKQYKAKKLLLCVGRIEQRKNIPALVDAMKDVNAKLLIVGGGPEENNIKQYIVEKKLEKKVFMLGRVDFKDLLALYASADLFTFSSLFEGFGMVYLEAMSSGTPVISYNIGAAKEIIARDVGALSAQNPKSLAKTINEGLKNKTWSKNCRPYVMKKYSIKRYLDNYEDAFIKLANEKK